MVKPVVSVYREVVLFSEVYNELLLRENGFFCPL